MRGVARKRALSIDQSLEPTAHHIERTRQLADFWWAFTIGRARLQVALRHSIGGMLKAAQRLAECACKHDAHASGEHHRDQRHER